MKFAKHENAPAWNGLLVDAHRHGLYDLHPVRTLAGIAVEDWESEPQFVEHERWTKQLRGSALCNALLPWLHFSRDEGVGSVLDFSGKHARAEVAAACEGAGLRTASPVWWDAWKPNLWPKPMALILPDERETDGHAAAVARDYLAAEPDGWLTLHAAESPVRAQIGKERLGGSIVVWLAREELLGPRTLLVHGNALGAADFELATEAGTAVVLCPAVREALAHPTPAVPSNMRVFFGTDAPLASGERSLLAQARSEVQRWSTNGSRATAVERAATALLRPLFNDKPPTPRASRELAAFLFNGL